MWVPKQSNHLKIFIRLENTTFKITLILKTISVACILCLLAYIFLGISTFHSIALFSKLDSAPVFWVGSLVNPTSPPQGIVCPLYFSQPSPVLLLDCSLAFFHMDLC